MLIVINIRREYFLQTKTFFFFKYYSRVCGVPYILFHKIVYAYRLVYYLLGFPYFVALHTSHPLSKIANFMKWMSTSWNVSIQWTFHYSTLYAQFFDIFTIQLILLWNKIIYDCTSLFFLVFSFFYKLIQLFIIIRFRFF